MALFNRRSMPADGKFDPILLGYGLCAQAVVGLVAKRSRIVVPRRHDCIGVFLGSEQARRDEIEVEPGTLYLTHGYIEGYRREEEGPLGEYNRMARRYGHERAAGLTRQTMRRYKRIVYLRNAHPEDLEGDRKYAQNMAKKFKMRYEEKDSDSSLLRRLTAFDWKHDFVVVEPGQQIKLEDFM